MTEPADGPPGPSRNGTGPPADAASPGLDMILEEIDQVVEPVTESVAMAPAVGIAVAGGPMITLPEDDRPRPRLTVPPTRSGPACSRPARWPSPAWSSTGPRRCWSSPWPGWSPPSPTAPSPSCSGCSSSCRCPARPSWSAWCAG